MNVAPLVSFLEREIGLSKTSAADPSFLAAINERVSKSGKPDVMAYLHFVSTDPAELEALVQAVLVPETWFFREEPSFQPVLAAIRNQHWGPQRVHLLSAPCSTGEEPYTLAMLMRQQGHSPDVFSVDGIDLSRPAIKVARRGLYSENSFRGRAREQQQEEFFRPHPQGWQLSSQVLEDVTFRVSNLLDRNSLNRNYYHVAVCRNLLIYLSERARREVLSSLKDALRDDGLLVLGIAEATSMPADLFIPYGDGPYPVFCKADGILKVQPKRAPKKRRGPPRLAPLSTELKPLPKLPKVTKGTRIKPAATPTKEVDLLEQARQLADRGNLEEASELCRRHLDSQGAHPEAYFLMALLSTSKGDDKAAEGELRKSVYLDPNHGEALLHLALLHERKGNSEAAEHFRRRAGEVAQS